MRDTFQPHLGQSRILVATGDLTAAARISERLDESDVEVVFCLSAEDFSYAVDVAHAIVDVALVLKDHRLAAEIGANRVPIMWIERAFEEQCVEALVAFGARLTTCEPRSILTQVAARLGGLWTAFGRSSAACAGVEMSWYQ